MTDAAKPNISFTVDGKLGYGYELGEVDDFARTATTLLEDVLFLRQYGERPPGAPVDDLRAETWADFDTRCEAFLRSLRYER